MQYAVGILVERYRVTKLFFMKSKLLFTVAICIISISGFSQKIQVGFKGGATVNKLTGKTFKEEFSFGYHLGGFVAIGLSKKFAIQPEILINQVNVDTSSNFSALYKFNKLDNVQLKYLSIPILLNYNASKVLTLQAGPQFGILINKGNTFVENGSNAFKTGDFAMLGGIQLNLNSFKIYGRYAVGLNNLNDIDNKDEWKNQSIQIGVGFKL
jgi:Outer membrane protein beta-barrel domain